MVLPITLTMAAAAAFLHIWLAIRCSMVRIKEKVMTGDGGSATMLNRMRAHSNFTENAPLFVILLGLNELADGSSRWLWGAGIVFIVARLSHAIGMDRPAPNIFRAGGMLLTTLVLIALSVSAVLLSDRKSVV